jgi:anti-sigma-K factor RskA
VSERAFDDETLMAHADGELDAQTAREVERAIRADPALAARVDAFRRTAEQARAAFAADLDQPVPAALLASVRAAAARAATRPAQAPAAEPFAAPRTPWWQIAANQPAFALAASVAILTAGFFGYFLGTTGDADPAGGLGLAASARENAAVLAALREVPSGERRALGASATVEMLASFRASGGALCREFKLVRAQRSETTALACASGREWTIAFEATAATSGSDYLPAGSQAAVDAYLGSIGAGAPLTAAEERAALAAER